MRFFFWLKHLQLLKFGQLKEKLHRDPKDSARKEHEVLAHPSLYDIVEFLYHADQESPENEFIDMELKKDGEIVRLRFARPINLKIESGFPSSTGGMVFYDVTGDGLEDIGIEVADFESTSGAITFFAKSVERLT